MTGRRLDWDRVNSARVLQILRDDRQSSRAALVRMTGLSAATISQITGDLIDRQLLKTAGTLVQGRGRPVEILKYDAESRYALGFEIHNHSVLGVKTDLYGRPLEKHRVEPMANGIDAVIAALVACVEELKGEQDAGDFVAIGVALPGGVDQKSGTITFSTEFQLSSVPIVDLLDEHLFLRPVVTNLSHGAGLAESWLGAASGVDHLVYIRLEESIGGAVLIDGLPFWGSTNSAGSIAHLPVQPNGLHCRCGSRGCLETVASGGAMARRAREEIKSGRVSSLVEQSNQNLNAITAQEVIDAARSRDQLALDVVAEAAAWLGLAVATCVNLLSPGMVVLGGELGRQGGELLAELVREEARKHVFSDSGPNYLIEATSLGEDAVACGAAATALSSGLTRSVALHAPLSR